MLIIRKEQLDAIDKALNESRPQRLMEAVQRLYPEESAKAGPDALKDYVEKGISKAEAFAIAPDTEVVTFVGLMLIWGIDFDERLPWAQATLNWETGTAAQKINQLKEKSAAEREKLKAETQS